MHDHITHARNTMFGPETCLLSDPCIFRLSPMHNEQSGRVIGRTFGRAMKFDVETPDGNIHQNLSDVRLDHAALTGERQNGCL